jgi:hypothetical protein
LSNLDGAAAARNGGKRDGWQGLGYGAIILLVAAC